MRLIKCIIVSVCVQVFKGCEVFCIRLYKCLVHSYSSFGSVNAYYPQFRFCFILLFRPFQLIRQSPSQSFFFFFCMSRNAPRVTSQKTTAKKTANHVVIIFFVLIFYGAGSSAT